MQKTTLFAIWNHENTRIRQSSGWKSYEVDNSIRQEDAGWWNHKLMCYSGKHSFEVYVMRKSKVLSWENHGQQTEWAETSVSLTRWNIKMFQEGSCFFPMRKKKCRAQEGELQKERWRSKIPEQILTDTSRIFPVSLMIWGGGKRSEDDMMLHFILQDARVNIELVPRY